MTQILTIMVMLISSIFIVFGFPILKDRINSLITYSWYNLDNLKDKDISYINKYSLSVIQKIYETNNVPSMKKIFIISLVLNLLYGVVLYTNIELHIMITPTIRLFGQIFFLTIGTLVVMGFEYYSYKINIKSLKEHIKTNSLKPIFYGLMKIIIFMFIFPLLLSGLILSINKFLGLLGVYILYFSPMGSLGFMLEIFNKDLGNSRFFLLLSTLSVFIPIIFLFGIKYFHTIIEKFLLPFIIYIDKLQICLEQDRNKLVCSKKMEMVIWFILFLTLFIQIIISGITPIN